MNATNADDAPYAIRDDLAAAQQTAWRRIAAPGDWLDGARRVDIAREVRRAWSCDLCARRKQALSPFAVEGAHDAATALDAVEIDAVHRIATDPGRLSRAWLDDCLAGGLRAEEYIEMVSVVCMVMMVDAFRRAIGQPELALPDAVAGAPTGYRAPGAKLHDSWLPLVRPGDQTPADGALYSSDQEPPVVTALSLVPSAKRAYWDLADAHYLPNTEVYNLETDIRAISRMQMEVLAARVSSVHQCAY
jgi:hypothetical protein